MRWSYCAQSSCWSFLIAAISEVCDFDHQTIELLWHAMNVILICQFFHLGSLIGLLSADCAQGIRDRGRWGTRRTARSASGTAWSSARIIPVRVLCSSWSWLISWHDEDQKKHKKDRLFRLFWLVTMGKSWQLSEKKISEERRQKNHNYTVNEHYCDHFVRQKRFLDSS